MAEWKNEQEARDAIKALVTDYYHDFRRRRPGSGRRQNFLCIKGLR